MEGIHFDVSAIGLRGLDRLLAQLPAKSERRIIRRVLRDSAKRIHGKLLQNVMGGIVGIRTGRFAMGIASHEVKGQFKRGRLEYGLMLPTREQLGIPPEAKHYYPAVLEYGAPHMSARAPMRRTVDDNAQAELALIGQEIGRGVERTAKRLGMVIK